MKNNRNGPEIKKTEYLTLIFSNVLTVEIPAGTLGFMRIEFFFFSPFLDVQ